jgi:hypothetical protein
MVEKNPVDFVRHGLILQQFTCRITELTNGRADHLTVAWVLISAALKADRKDRKERDVTHGVRFG